MNTYFTADTHFCHKNIIRYCSRPFATIEQMNQAIVHNWNAKVKPEDEVYHLGDFAFGRDATPEWIRKIAEQLNGKIYFIKGNHDKVTLNTIPRRFTWVKDYAEIEVSQQRIVLFHYGLRTWHHDMRGTWHLYGHSHNGLPPYGKSFDIGVDCWKFEPLSFAEVKAEMDKRPVAKHPEFSNFDAALSALDTLHESDWTASFKLNKNGEAKSLTSEEITTTGPLAPPQGK